MSPYSSGVAQADDVGISQADNHGPDNQTVAPKQPQSVWPTETDILYSPGTRRMMLTVQRPVMRMVIQDAFEQVKKSMMLTDAFPNTFIALEFTRDGLFESAEAHDEATDIYNRLLCDAAYMNQMTRLVRYLILIMMLLILFQPRARIPHFRAEVKERFVAILQAEFLSLGSAEAVAALVKKQTEFYNYTFPTAPNVSLTSPDKSS